MIKNTKKMNYILLCIFYYNILSTISANQNIPKFCKDCKFFKNDFFSGSEFAKCSAFPIIEIEKDNSVFLVNGYKKESKKDFKYCSTARQYEHLCGKEGKFYERKV
jgi:hypothetical protein